MIYMIYVMFQHGLLLVDFLGLQKSPISIFTQRVDCRWVSVKVHGWNKSPMRFSCMEVGNGFKHMACFFCVHPVFFVGEILSNLSIFFSNGWFIPTSYIVDDLPDLGEQLATNSQGEMDVDPVRKWKKQKKIWDFFFEENYPNESIANFFFKIFHHILVNSLSFGKFISRIF